MLSRTQLAARLKAARWLLAGYDEKEKPKALTVAELVSNPLLIRNRVTKNRIEDFEQAKADHLDWEVEKLAEATGLPLAWFTEPDWRVLLDQTIPALTPPEEELERDLESDAQLSESTSTRTGESERGSQNV